MRDVFEKQIEELRKIDPTKVLVGTLKRDVEYYSKTVDDAERMLENARIRYATVANESGSGSGAGTEITNLLVAYEKQEDVFGKSLNEMKAMYDQTQKWLSSTDKDVQKQGEEMYGKLKEQGTDYLDFLIKLRDKEWANLNEKDRATLTSAIAGETQPKEQKQEKTENPYDKVLEEYKSYTRAKEEIDAKYQQDYILLAANGRQEEAQMAKDAWDKALADLNEKYGKSILKSSAPLAAAMEKAGRQTRKSLKDSLNVLDKVAKYKKTQDERDLEGSGVSKEEADKINLQELEDIYQQLIDLQEEYDKKSNFPFRNLIEGFKALKKAKSDETSKEDKILAEARAEKMLGAAVENSAQAFSTLGQMMQDIGSGSGSARIQQLGETFSQVGSFISSVVSGFKSGSYWGAIIAGVTSLVSMASQGASKVAQANQQMTDSYYAFAKAVRESNLALDETKYENIFGTNNVAKANEALSKYNENLEKYNEYVNKSSGKTRYDLGYNHEHGGSTAVGDGFWGEFWNPRKQKQGKYGGELVGVDPKDYQKQLTDLQAIEIQTYEATWKERHAILAKNRRYNEYTTLADYKLENGEGLFDENGELIVKNAKMFLDTVQNIDATERDMIQKAVDYGEAMESAREVIEGISKDLMQNIASEVGDAIQDAVLNGADSWDAFEKSGAQVIKHLGDMLVQNFLMEEWLNKHADALTDSMSSGFSSGDWSAFNEELRQMGEEYKTVSVAATEGLKSFYEGVETGAGISLDSIRNINEQNREASAKGIAQASQDSIDELNGRMTAVQGHTFNISQNSTILAQRSGEILQVLMGIRTDTARLESIEGGINSMRADLSQMNTKGVIVRR